MDPGLVTKKIALFETKTTTLVEQQCRIKRQNAVRRKKKPDEERPLGTHTNASKIHLSTSIKNLNRVHSFPLRRCKQFSTSCSTLAGNVSEELALYENILPNFQEPCKPSGAPPLPPKPRFGKTSTTNHAFLPIADNRNLKTLAVADIAIEKNLKCSIEKTVISANLLHHSKQSRTTHRFETGIRQMSNETSVNEDTEHFYEDVHDDTHWLEPNYRNTSRFTSTYGENKRCSCISHGKWFPLEQPFFPNHLSGSNSGSLGGYSPSVSSGGTYGYSSDSTSEYGSQSKYVASIKQTGFDSGSDADEIYNRGASDKLSQNPCSKCLGMRIASKSSSDYSQRSSLYSSNVLKSNCQLHLNELQMSNNMKAVMNSTNDEPGGNIFGRPTSLPIVPSREPPKNDAPFSVGKTTNSSRIYNVNKHDSDCGDSHADLIRNLVSQYKPFFSMEEEPLYQYYANGVSLMPDDEYQPAIPVHLGDTLGKLVTRGGQRTLWCELPGVISSGILSILSEKQKKLQEAIFEIITSEVSYQKSLDVLISLFYKNYELIKVLTNRERDCLFGNIEAVRESSQAFLSDLLAKWEESWYVQEIGDIILHNAQTTFLVYREYCRNKPYQDKMMQKLRQTREQFVNIIQVIEKDGRCQKLPLGSFLMLPMQRITRLPLLVNAALQGTAAKNGKGKGEEALKCLENIVKACNNAAKESQDALTENETLLEKLELTKGIRSFSDFDELILTGDFVRIPSDLTGKNQSNWRFWKAKKQSCWLFLFSKQLLVTQKTSNGRFKITDVIDPLDSHIKALPNIEEMSEDFPHVFLLYFTNKPNVYFLSARTNLEVEKWKSELDGTKSNQDIWVQAIHPFNAGSPTEMSIFVGDIISVSQIQIDGWYFGSSLKSGESGWFPGNCCSTNTT